MFFVLLPVMVFSLNGISGGLMQEGEEMTGAHNQQVPERDIFIDEDIQLIHLGDSAYMHVTWDNSEQYGRFSSNGMIYIKNGRAIMVDTPMDNDKTSRLTKYLRNPMNVEVTMLIAGHFHDDCTGGLEYIQGEGIESVACQLTVDKCSETGLPVPSTSFKERFSFEFNGVRVECRFFGGGHSFDNITVWFPESRILFGGCLIKPARSGGLGNLSDAVPDEWDETVRKLQAEYPDIRLVVPGHGDYGGAGLLDHTIDLVIRHKQNRLPADM